jgi:holo-[acyl-carrier protein] synthase
LVLGLGTDITEVPRIQASLDRFGEHFLQRVYTPGEVAYCQARKKSAAQSLAARFAAKEAGAKALGTGISRGVTWRELEVVRRPGCAPELVLHGRAREIAAGKGVTRLTLSLTHTNAVAMAVVIAEGEPSREAGGADAPERPQSNGAGTLG